MSNLVAIERTPETIAAEINGIKEQTKNMVLYSSIEIGRRLVEAKSKVAHGEWGEWLQKYVDYSQSTANNLMKLYHEYGTNPQALGNLNYTQAVALLGVPAEEREAFAKENNVEKMSSRQLQKAIRERQQAIKEKEELERKLRESEERAEKERLELQKLNDRLAELESEKNQHDQMIEQLKEKLSQAKAAGNNEEAAALQQALDKSKQELEMAQTKVKELEQQLKQQPIDVPAVVEKVPDEIQRELEELRKQVKTQNNKPLMQFSYCFETIVNRFQELINILEDVKEMNHEEHDKYKGAVNGLLEQMKKSLET